MVAGETLFSRSFATLANVRPAIPARRYCMRRLVSGLVQFVSRLRNGIKVFNSDLEKFVEEVNTLQQQVRDQDDERIRQLAEDAALQNDLRQLFAAVREASDRALKLRPYDVQIMAARALYDGRCIEMQTGEGKTLAAAVAACVKALSGSRCHVLTFNDYLAARDAEWMKPLYEFFKLRVGYVVQATSRPERQTAYRSDITYITAREAGFDYLRDQLACHVDDLVQAEYPFAIVDEADSILIDEARIPLVIAAEMEADGTNLQIYSRLVRELQPQHVSITSGRRNVSLTEEGILYVERRLGIDELHTEENGPALSRLNVALQAEFLLKRDIDYIVRDGHLELIDEFTGRVAPNRKWPGGLQAALEAKEGLGIQPQGQILNSITLQHYMQFYEQLAGMTGTAAPAAEEFLQLYKLQVVIIPTHRECIRNDQPDRIFRTAEKRADALVQEILQQHRRSRPVLVGTGSVEESEELAQRLGTHGLSCRVLNAANDHLEAEIISEAGAPGALTISTNMAGRGTDICPGGRNGAHRKQVLEAGGLYVIGTNRHESRRIDNQLRGRSGRQGDPGESRFFISLEDDLIRRHGIADLLDSSDCTDEAEVNDRRTAEKISFVQRVIEGEGLEIRRTLRVYSELLEIQRRRISADRKSLLTGAKLPNALRTQDPALFQALISRYGESVVLESERRVTLIHVDWCWSEHLARAGEIRHGIHLASYGGMNPFDVFNRQMRLEFDSFLSEVQSRVVQTLQNGEWSESGIDLEAEGLRAPSSTWTFMINDNPRGTVLNILLRGVVRRLKEAFRQ